MSLGERVASLFASISVDLSDLDRGLTQMSTKMKAAGDAMTSLGNKLTVAITLPVVGAAAAMTKMAMDAVESENLFEVSMGEMAGAAREFSEELRDQFGLNGYEVRKQLGTWNSMLEAMGMGTDAAFDMSQGLTMLANDMASFYNMSPEEAFEKLSSAMSGEIEPMKRLGVVISETAVKEYALANSLIKSGEEMSESQKVMARYGLIMQQTSNAQGDLARTIDSPSNQLRILRARLEETAIEAGEVFLPALSTALNWINKVGMPAAVKALDDVKTAWTDMSDHARVKVLVVAGLLIGGGPLMSAIGISIRGVGMLMAAFQMLPGKVRAAVLLSIPAMIELRDWMARLFRQQIDVNEMWGRMGVPGAQGTADMLKGWLGDIESLGVPTIKDAMGAVADAGIEELARMAETNVSGFFDQFSNVPETMNKVAVSTHNAGTAAKFVGEQFKVLPKAIKDSDDAAAKARKEYMAATGLIRAQMTALTDAIDDYGLHSEQARAMIAKIGPELDALKAKYPELSAIEQQEVDNMVNDLNRLIDPVKAAQEAAEDAAAKARKAAAAAAAEYSDSTRLIREQMTALKDSMDDYGVHSEQARSMIAKIGPELDALKAKYPQLSAIEQQEVDNMVNDFNRLINSVQESTINVSELQTALISMHPATIAAAAAVSEWGARIQNVNLALVANRDQVQAAQRELQGMQDQLSGLNGELSTAKNRLSELSAPKLKGMGEIDTQIEVIQERLKRLDFAELSGMDMSEVEKLFPAMAKGSDEFMASLPKTEEELRKLLNLLQATRGLKFDEQMRALAAAAGDAKKELTFEDALAQITDTKGRIGELTGAISQQEAAIRGQQSAIQSMQGAADVMNRTLAEFQNQLQQAKANQESVTQALEIAYGWYMEDREKIAEMGAEGERVAGVMDEKTRELLEAIALAATDTTGASQAVLAELVKSYQRDMALAMLEVNNLHGELAGIPTELSTMHTTYHRDVYLGGQTGPASANSEVTSEPQLPYAGEYASGGIVPGPRGAPMLAMVHGQETILPAGAGGRGWDYDKLAAAMARISIELDGQAVARIITTRQGHLVRL